MITAISVMVPCLVGLAAAASPVPEGGSLEGFDIGPFARVVTWDPGRTYGALATRLVRFPAEEFRAEDIYTETDLLPDGDGLFRVPVDEHGRGCIGLQWIERRPVRRVELRFADPAQVPRTVGVQVQRWDEHEGVPYPLDHGTPWQGNWVALRGRIEEEGPVWRFEIDPEEFPEGNPDVRKIRWTFPPSPRPVVVERPAAYIVDDLAETALTLTLETPLEGQAGEVEPYNAEWVMPAESPSRHARRWDLGSPLRLTVRAPAGPDRKGLDKLSSGRLLVTLPSGAFAVDLDDLVREGAMYVPAHGFFAALDSARTDLSAYRKGIEGQRTVLERVRDLPDQTFDQAWTAVFDEALRTSPTLLSLANDNRKCAVQRTGRTDWLSFAVEPALSAGRVRYVQRDTPLIPGRNTAAHGVGQTGDTLRIGETAYASGLGLHANGELRIALDGQYRRFLAVAGVQWVGGESPGTVTVDIEIDGRRAGSSGVLTENGAPYPIDVPLDGARELVLRLGDGGDGITCDMTVLAEARLLRAEDAEPEYLADALVLEDEDSIERRLDGRWLPAPVIVRRRGDLVFTQRTFVVPFDGEGLEADPLGLSPRPLAVLELNLENKGDRAAYVSPQIDFSITRQRPGLAEFQAVGDFVAHAELRPVPEGVVVSDGDRLLAFVATQLGTLRTETGPGQLRLLGELPAASSASLTVYVPEWDVEATAYAELARPDAYDDLGRYWERVFAGSMQVEVPNPFLNDLVRASQVHCMLASRNERDGAHVVPHIASIYPPLESEANAIIRAMYVFGNEAFARRSLDYYISRYTDAGYLDTVYTLMATGWHLQTAAEFHAITQDGAWLERHAPEFARAGRWIVGERAKTMQWHGAGPRPPEYGLAPPYNLADWGAYAYYFSANGYFCAGLLGAADLLKPVGHPEEAAFRHEAAEYREAILAAFRWAQARTPVRPLLDGTWVPGSPAQIHVPGRTVDYFFTSDGGRCQAYDVELGSHHLVPQGVLAPDAPEVDHILNALEDIEFLSEGFLGYPEENTRKDWYNLGGFGRLQPYYARNAEIYALRDEVRPFIRAYFNTVPSLVNPEDLSFWEHFAAHGAWNKTHETGYFLHQTRLMLIQERGNELWLAPFVTANWLQDGMRMSVRQAPTRFGPMAYRIESHVDQGWIEATIDPPTRKAPEAVVIRLRHPQGKPIRSANVTGAAEYSVDAARDCIRIVPAGGPMVVRAAY